MPNNCFTTTSYTKIRWNNAKWGPLRRSRSFRVIQGHRFWYQSKLMYDFLLVININLLLILHRLRDIAFDNRYAKIVIFGYPSSCSCSRSLYAVARPSVTLAHPTQGVVNFSNFSTAFGTLVIHWHAQKFLLRMRSSQGNPSVGGVKPERGSKI